MKDDAWPHITKELNSALQDVPNFKDVPAQLNFASSPCNPSERELRTAREKVPMQQAKNTFQIISNFQNLLTVELTIPEIKDSVVDVCGLFTF